MPKLKVFVSSTCYDLSIVRSELNKFIESIGFESVLSDLSDVLYDPRFHTHENCIKEVENCDMMVFIVGSRFGGEAIPQARCIVDFNKLKHESRKPIESYSTVSITQLEVSRGIELGIPIYTFIDDRVNNDHLIYEKNKTDDEIISRIKFASIDKPETAKYIFEFINFIRGRFVNNNIQTFRTIDDIKIHLKKQWSSLFQRLLHEQQAKEKRDNFKGLKKVHIETFDNLIFENLKNSTSIEILSNTSKSFFKQFGDSVMYAVKTGCDVRIALSSPKNIILRDESIRTGLCKNCKDIIDELYEVFGQISNIISELKKQDPPIKKGSIQVKTFFCVPTCRIIILNDKIIRYTPYLPFYESQSVPMFDIYNQEGSELFASCRATFNRVWENSEDLIGINFVSGIEVNNLQKT